MESIDRSFKTAHDLLIADLSMALLDSNRDRDAYREMVNLLLGQVFELDKKLDRERQHRIELKRAA